MQSTGRPLLRRLHRPWRLLVLLVCIVCWATRAHGMTDEAISNLRQETRDIFYHGYENYMQHAFPEDELRPLTCVPLTRNRRNPADIEVNDVLGNYSLTLIDSLSTLAILASSPPPTKRERNKPLDDFQDGIQLLVEYYGDGTKGPRGEGKRARGFDLDSKVQVFETVIRGVGGLLSAHLFAAGDLPIRGYVAKVEKKSGKEGLFWRNGLVYDGQLLRLATDLAERLMPAFYTPTGLPYPRVNLRYGVNFYENSPYYNNAEQGQCKKNSKDKDAEVTETCSAGAGSLVLEFSTLSRLTGDPRFEGAAKQAFWAVWTRRSAVGLIGAGIDSETGQWVSPYTGIGAGIDSFFEYSLKSHILLSGLSYDVENPGIDSPDAFLKAWQEAHEGIKRHIYRGAAHQHPHYVQVDLYTGAMRAYWIDSLSAYYQGLLTLAGELDEAIETHLLFTALWTRYSAMPERWSTATGNIESGLRWWGGRPEFIESTWYLYRATNDPWYLHVGEMALRDIKRRCWTQCGWAGLQDVRTGELNDRMESFFLGETVKYLFLLFDPSHPLNTLDSPIVFTTEGHPLIIPKRLRPTKFVRNNVLAPEWQPAPGTCPTPPAPVPFSVSATAARSDIFHAANLARLHYMPTIGSNTLDSPLVEFTADHPSISISDIQSPSNYTYYPWTLPPELIPYNAMSSKMAVRTTFDLSFPNLPNTLQNSGLSRINEGILVNSMSGLRLGMIRESDSFSGERETEVDEQFRIYAISNLDLGRDEKVYMSRSTIESFNPLDPFFTRTRDAATFDLVIDASPLPVATPSSSALADFLEDALDENASLLDIDMMETFGLDAVPDALASEPSYLASLLASLQHLLSPPSTTSLSPSSSPKRPQGPPQPQRIAIAGTLPIGPGSAPLPDTPDPDLAYSASNTLSWTSIYIHPTVLCDERLPIDIPRSYQIIVVPRGGCSFSDKLHNIPAFPPDSASLQVVVIVSYPKHEQSRYDLSAQEKAAENSVDGGLGEEEQKRARARGKGKRRTKRHEDENRDKFKDSAAASTITAKGTDKAKAPRPSSSKMSNKKKSTSDTSLHKDPYNALVQPLLDELQFTPSGLPRSNPIPLIMVRGGDETMALLKRASGVGIRRKYYFRSQGVKIANLFVL